MNHTVIKTAKGSEKHTWEVRGFKFELEMSEELSPGVRTYALKVTWQRDDKTFEKENQWYKDGIYDPEGFENHLLMEAHFAIQSAIGENNYPFSKWADPFILDWEAYFDPTVSSDDDPDDLDMWRERF